jgi:L-serine dehydratase
MSTSVFDLFKIGIGPSSSHTVGPMVAARGFLEEIAAAEGLTSVSRVSVSLHGSLAFTGKGHGTDSAILLGLAGERPDSVDPDTVPDLLDRIRETGKLRLLGGHEIAFEEPRDLVLDYDEILSGHANGMRFRAYGHDGGVIRAAVVYSIGGGFIATEAELASDGPVVQVEADQPHPFTSAGEMLAMGKGSGLTVAGMVMANECASRTADDVRAGILRIWDTMSGCIDRGMAAEGQLPGGLKVRRRAAGIHRELLAEAGRNAKLPHDCIDWVSLWAIAVNEENAAGGRIVTAPTNGAAGVIPAVARYYREFFPAATEDAMVDFFLAATAIGSLIKLNASISGAEVGCQGEVGSASAMAAAGLAAALGGTNEQIENAAEIALEHHLGMTCDPVGGLVQIPCIERNAMGAVKAINAASLALKGDGTHYVSLDAVVETMRQTGLDMASKYKETSQGGLAVNVVAC